MKSFLPTCFFAALLAVCVCCVSCDSGGAALLPAGANPAADNSSSGAGGGSEPGRLSPFDGALSARVRNESSARVDVTMRFIRDNAVIHLAFVRVPASTITTVASPGMAELVELTGVDESGRALESASYKYGVDFDENKPAEYVVVNRNSPGVPVAQPTGALRLSLIEPALDTAVTLGSAVRVQWDDGGAGPSALVRLFLRPEGVATASASRVLSPAIGASLDGINDEFALVVQDVVPGRYELVAELSDGDQSVLAVAPGRVVVADSAANKAPKVTITEPSGSIERYAGEVLNVSWTDADADDNATIVFSLEQPQTATATGGSFRIGPPIAENPDGRSADSLAIPLTGVLPGLYDLVATIDDGALKGIDRVEGAVRILPALSNDPPHLVLLSPARDTAVLAGGTVQVRWTDGDDNDNARISFLIDANWNRVDLGGGERLLLSGLNEDDDGADGLATLSIPPGLSAGKYRLIGVITDGMTQVITRAPGFLLIEGDPTVNVADGGNTDNPADTGNGSDNSGEDNGSGGSDNGSGSGDDGSAGDGSTGDTGDNVADGGNSDTGNTGDTGTGDSGNNNGGDQGTGNSDGNDNTGGTDNGDQTGDTGNDTGGDGNGNGNDPLSPGVVVIDAPGRIPNERPATPASGIVIEIGLIPQTPVIPAGLALTNEPYGGDVHVELDPPASWRGAAENSLMQLNIPIGVIPNGAWPRRFDLIVRYEVDGSEQFFVWPRPIQIPQLVEVNFAELSDSICSHQPVTQLGPRRFTGLAVGWYGGGVAETTGQAHVQFWLSNDGFIPHDGREDPGHRLVYSGLGSPNEYQVSQIDLFTVVMGGLADFDNRALNRGSGGDTTSPHRHVLTPGAYSLITVVDYGPFGRVVSRPDVQAVQVCPAAIDMALSD